jgi:hypothetical protein
MDTIGFSFFLFIIFFILVVFLFNWNNKSSLSYTPETDQKNLRINKEMPTETELHQSVVNQLPQPAETELHQSIVNQLPQSVVNKLSQSIVKEILQTIINDLSKSNINKLPISSKVKHNESIFTKDLSREKIFGLILSGIIVISVLSKLIDENETNPFAYIFFIFITNIRII